MSWSTSELRVRLAPLNWFKPSSKIFYWQFQGGTSFVDLLCFCSVLCLLCLCALCGHLLGKGWPLSSRLWCLLWVCHFPIGILGQVWYLIVSIPDLCTLTYFEPISSQALHHWAIVNIKRLNIQFRLVWSTKVLLSLNGLNNTYPIYPIMPNIKKIKIKHHKIYLINLKLPIYNNNTSNSNKSIINTLNQNISKFETILYSEYYVTVLRHVTFSRSQHLTTILSYNWRQYSQNITATRDSV